MEFPGYDSLDPADFESYFLAVTDVLNAASPDSFQPSLTLLDSLIQSISIGTPWEIFKIGESLTAAPPNEQEFA